MPKTLLPLGMVRAVDLDVIEQGACGATGDGRGVAEELLDGRRHQGGLGTQSLGLFGVLDQRHCGAADQVGGRVVAGQHEEEDHRDDLVGAERVAVLAGCKEGGDQPVVGLGTALLGQPLEDRVELARRGDGPHCVRGRATAQADDESLHEHVELVPVLVADAQHRRDDRQRQGDSHVIDQVDRLAPSLFHLVQQLGHDPLDLAGHLLHPARRERLVHQPPQPGVVGIVLVDHAAHQQPEHAGQMPHQEAGALTGGIAREPHVVVEQHDVLVPRQHVAGAAQQLLGVGAGHGRGAAQLGVARIRVGEHDRVGEVGRLELSCRCGVGHHFPRRSLTRGSGLLTSNSVYSIRPPTRPLPRAAAQVVENTLRE